MLNLYLDYYGEYAENKYRDMYLYDEQGVYMTFHDCYVFLVRYDGSKRIKMTDNIMNMCSYLEDAVALIDKKYKVGEDTFYVNKVCWHLKGKVRLARKFDLSRKDNFSFPAKRKERMLHLKGKCMIREDLLVDISVLQIMLLTIK